MTVSFIIIAIVILCLLGLIICINIIAVDSVKNLLLITTDDALQVVDKIDDARFMKIYDDLSVWAEKNMYQHDCFFLSYTAHAGEPLKCAAWWSEKERTWMLVYFFQIKHDVIKQDYIKNNVDFVTIYNDIISITTSSTKDAIMLPRPPKSYMQAFANLTTDDLHLKHLDARLKIENHESVLPPKDKPELFNEIKKSLVSQARFIMSLPLWKFHGIYWFFIRGNIMANKSV